MEDYNSKTPRPREGKFQEGDYGASPEVNPEEAQRAEDIRQSDRGARKDKVSRRSWITGLGLVGLVVGGAIGLFSCPFTRAYLNKNFINYLRTQSENSNRLIVGTVVSEELYQDYFHWSDKVDQNPEYGEFFSLDPNLLGMEELKFVDNNYKSDNMCPVYIINIKTDKGRDISFRVIECGTTLIRDLEKKIKAGSRIAFHVGNTYCGDIFGAIDVEETNFEDLSKTRGSKPSDRIYVIDKSNESVLDYYGIF